MLNVVKPWQRLQIGGVDTNVHMHCMCLTHNYSSSSCHLKWYAGVHHVPFPFEVLRNQFMCYRNYEHWRAVRRGRQTDRHHNIGGTHAGKDKRHYSEHSDTSFKPWKVQVLIWYLIWTKLGWWWAFRISCSEGQWFLTWKVLGLLGQIWTREYLLCQLWSKFYTCRKF
jgi:hypothetical protein